MGGGASKSQLEEKVRLLKGTPFFTSMEDENALRELAGYFKLEHIRDGDFLQAAAFVVVVDGELALSTLVPRGQSARKSSASAPGKSKTNPNGHVSELLAVKKTGDFFTRAGRELATSTGGSQFLKKPRVAGSAQKVVNAFDFTTVRALRDTIILKLDESGKRKYLEKNAKDASAIQRVLNTDIKQMLKPIPFLGNLDKQRLSSLAELFTYETHEAGSVVLQEGALDDSFYLVLSGKLDVTARISPDKQATHAATRSVTRIVAQPQLLLDRPDEDDAGDLDRAKSAATETSIPEGERESSEAGDSESDQAANTAPQDVDAGAKGESGSSGEEAGAADVVNDLPNSQAKRAADEPKRSLNVGGDYAMLKKQRDVPVLRPQPSMRLLRKSSSLVNESVNMLNLATIEDGSYFGEMGMMVNMPRTATVTATERCLLAKMKGSEFANFLKLSPAVQESIDFEARQRMVRKLYAFRLPFFAGIAKDKLLELANLCELQQHSAGTVLMEEGGWCETFYIVIGGLVNVIKNGKAIVRLAQGAYFGEISMITGRPHLATVAAHSDVVLLAVTKEAFDTFFKGSAELLAEFEMRVLGEKEIMLKHVLKHTLGRELFRQHLENEFTVEHLDFWEAVNNFRLGQESYGSIVSRFIGPNSKTPINVSANMSQAVLDGEESPTCFDQCHTETFNLMKRDNFERFKKTVLFAELMDAICCYTNEDLNIDEADLRRAEMSFGRSANLRQSLAASLGISVADEDESASAAK